LARAKKSYAPKTSKHFADTPQYKRLVNILHNTDTNREAAERIGVSPSTIRRWATYGISNRALKNQKIQSKITRVSAGFSAYRKTVDTDDQKEYRAFSYRRDFGKAFTKYWNVENASYGQIQEIILRECRTNLYAGYYFLLKFDTKFEGFWDSHNAEFYALDGKGGMSDSTGRKLEPKERQYVRDNGSFVSVNLKQPFLNTSVFTLDEGQCSPDVLQDTLLKFYYMQHFTIIEVRFNSITYEGNYYQEAW